MTGACVGCSTHQDRALRFESWKASTSVRSTQVVLVFNSCFGLGISFSVIGTPKRRAQISFAYFSPASIAVGPENKRQSSG
jgi:hypothetical protein